MEAGSAETPLLTKMSNSIWMEEKICTEEKYLKKKWFIRNGQEIDKEGNYEKQVIFLVIEKAKRKNVTFGPAIQVAVSPFTSGRGKKKVVHEALCFPCVTKNGFISVIVNYDNFDMEISLNFTEDILLNEYFKVIGGGKWNNLWFATFISTYEEMVLPRVQMEYEKRAGAPWKNPLKLKLKSPLNLSQSMTPSSSTARGLAAEQGEKVHGADEQESGGTAGPLDLPAPPLAPAPIVDEQPPIL